MTLLEDDLRAALRAEAHKLKPLVHVGHAGLTPALLQSLDDVLRTHELVKVQVAKAGDLSAKEAANDIAAQLHAEVIQVIGRKTTLYRHNPELHGKPDAPPAWR